MGDSILNSMSLPPSGKVPSNQTEEAITEPSHDTQHKSPFITPVFGTISNRDVPVMSSKCQGTAAAEPLLTAVKHRTNKSEESIERHTSKTLGGIKRRKPDISDSEEEAIDIVGRKKKEKRRNLDHSARRLRHDSQDQSSDENQEDGAGVKIKEEPLGRHLDVHLPQSPSTRSTFLTCLQSKPRVVLRRLSLTTRGGDWSVSPVKTSARSRASSRPPKSRAECSTWRNKE